jgi:predicted transcriptional regulator of viral defense system
MRASLIWEKLRIEKKKIVTSKEIRELAKEVSKDEDQLIDYLRRNGYLERILRGLFYVKSLEERERHTYEHSIYERVAMALKEKGVKNWYYGLETALKLNTMTHEYFNIDYVITDSFRTTKVISIAGQSFHFIKRGGKHFKDGITKERGIRYSIPEKTVLDIAYRSYLKTKKEALYIGTIREYRDRLDRKKARKHLVPYPKKFRESVEVLL